MNEHKCRVCGLFIEDAPWGNDNQSPTYEICPCCGVEFGNEDYTLDSVRNYRTKWLENGANWFTNKVRPINWNLQEQLVFIPEAWY